MKYLASIFFLASFSLSAAFEDYSSIQSFLLDSDPRNEKVFVLKENQSTYIPRGSVHRLENYTNKTLEIIEIQTGNYLGEDDIIRLEDDYSRT